MQFVFKVYHDYFIEQIKEKSPTECNEITPSMISLHNSVFALS